MATRAVALGIDALIIQAILLVTAAIASLVADLVGGIELHTTGKVIVACGWALFTLTYFVVSWSAGGQTPGMRAMHLTVTTNMGARPGIARSVIRAMWLAICILTAFLGFLPVLFDDRRRGLHDIVARTVVRYADPGAA